MLIFDEIRRSQRIARLARWVPLVPAVVWLTAFLALPLAIIVRYGFAERAPYGGVVPTWTLANFAQAIQPPYLAVYWRSLWMALATTAACAALAYPAAYFIAVKSDRKWKSVWLTLAVVPFWTSFLIRTYAWMFILRTEGLANALLMKCGLISAPLPLLYNDFAVLLGLVYGELPFMLLPLYASLEKLDRRLLEAAADLDAPPWRTFWRVTLPLSRPGLLAGALLTFIPSLGAFVTSDLLGGAKSVLIGNLIQNQFVQRNQPFGSAVAILLTAVVLALLAIGLRAGAAVGHR
jgi:spermidine/putrescine transport system permease protein